MDLTHSRMFKSSAFEPSEEELKERSRARRRRTNASRDSDSRMSSSSPSPSPRKVLYLPDSDDELPDMSQILAERGNDPAKRGRYVENEEEESSDEEQNTLRGSQKTSKPARPQDVRIIFDTACPIFPDSFSHRMISSISQLITYRQITR